jgi:uncharacterized protein (TIGR02996 family)
MAVDAHEAAAFAAVIARPDDDAARLAYADAIVHHDAERAELIGVQVEQARARREHFLHDRESELYRREQALLNRCASAWGAPLADIVIACKFRRGFAEEVTMDTAAFLARSEELFARAPILHLTLRDAAGHVAALFASHALGRLRSLSLYQCRIGDAGARHLADSPHLERLRWLDLSFNDIGMPGLEAIAASPRLPSLGYLGFRNNAVAEDPTPRVGGQEANGLVHDMEHPALGRELVRRFGDRPWLTVRVRPDWPPDRDAV